MLSDSCPSVCLVCLSVGDVDVLWPNGWMDQGETWLQVGLGPGHVVLDGDPAPLLQRERAPNFWPYLLWPNCWMDQDVTW